MSPTNSKTQQDTELKQQRLLPVDPDKAAWLKSKIRDIPDFPKPGVIFKDLTTLLKDAEALSYVVNVLAEHYEPLKPKYVAGIEARGFIFGTALAYQMGIGFIPIRKPGKLPHKVETVSYDLEYGTDSIEVHMDAFARDEKVVLIDDLLATGGTATAALSLLRKLGANVVGVGFLVELGFLKGRAKFPADADVFSVITYD